MRGMSRKEGVRPYNHAERPAQRLRRSALPLSAFYLALMNKENSLYGIIGLLIGLIIGYAGTNYINGGVSASRPDAIANSTSLPADHPPATKSDSSSAGGGAQGDVMA